MNVSNTKNPLGRTALGALAFIAAIPRCVNLGSFSMWLDEILQTRMARGSFGELWSALVRDQVHPPLDSLITWLTLRLTTSEEVRRLLPILLGLATVLVLSRWVSERFGRSAGWATGLLAAFSPIHVQYSQELRPYSLALFLLCCAVWRFDNEMRAEQQRLLAPWMLPAMAALYSLYFSIIFVVPLLVLTWGRWCRDRPSKNGTLWRLGGQLSILFGALAPWVIAVLGQPRRAVEAAAQVWTFDEAFQRWHRLTLGGLEGDAATPMGFLPLGLLVLALVVERRRVETWALFGGAAAGTLGIELLLTVADHWSNSRYNLVAWPFITALLGIGAANGGHLVGRLVRARSLAVGLSTVTVAMCCLAQSHHLERYYDRGRPHWAWVAESVASFTVSEGRVLVSNDWSRICLGYYLAPYGVEITPGDTQKWLDTPEAQHTPATPGCTYLVDGGFPKKKQLLRALAPVSEVAVDPGGLGARVVRLGRFDPTRRCSWSLPPHLEQRPGWQPGHSAVPERWVFEFNRPMRRRLLSGWGDLERAPNGRSFAWMTAKEAFVALGPLDQRARNLRLRARSLTSNQRVQLALNGHHITDFSLDRRWDDFTFQIPENFWSERDNLLHITCSRLNFPPNVDPQRPGARRLAIAVDQLVVEPHSM